MKKMKGNSNILITVLMKGNVIGKMELLIISIEYI
jgi:hypothetical protein